MEMEVRCRNCGKGVFRIERCSAFTTRCDHCDHLDLDYRVKLFGVPRVLWRSDQDEPRVKIEETIDQIISHYIDQRDIGALKLVQAEDISDLVNSLCGLYLNEQSKSPRNAVFSWADQAAPGDNDVIELGFAIAKHCQEKTKEIKQHMCVHAGRQAFWDQVEAWNPRSSCPYCQGAKCEWCNYTGVSWRYWLAVKKLIRDGGRAGITALF